MNSCNGMLQQQGKKELQYLASARINLINNAGPKTASHWRVHTAQVHSHKVQKLAKLNDTLFGIQTHYKAKSENEQNLGW